MYSDLPKEIIDQMVKDRLVRKAIARENHWIFFSFYFPHYLKYPTADFQREIFALTQDCSIQNLFIVAFRGSAKSTIITFSYAIWAILGVQQKKFVIILGQTRAQVKQHMVNLKRELESNELLKNDLGPFSEETDEWGTSSLVFSHFNARISIASSEQSIRGLRHNQHRPDLIIGDDVEDMNSAKTREGRDKTYQWLSSEVIPTGDKNTRLVIIGNLLHEDSLLMRLKQDLDEGKIEGTFKAYPLLNEKNQVLWPGKYSTPEELEKEKRKSGNEVAWQREYLLKIVPNEGQVIFRDWIQYYDDEDFPIRENERKTLIGVDLAISQKDTADFTAVVTAVLAGRRETFCAYILPEPINRKMSFPETILTLKAHTDAMKTNHRYVKLMVEDVGYQKAVIEQLQNDGYKAEGIKVVADKRSRLMTISSLVKSGKIKFPRKGAERLIEQLVGFGTERHDDLADAFSIVAHQALKEDKSSTGVLITVGNPFNEYYYSGRRSWMREF